MSPEKKDKLVYTACAWIFAACMFIYAACSVAELYLRYSR